MAISPDLGALKRIAVPTRPVAPFQHGITTLLASSTLRAEFDEDLSELEESDESGKKGCDCDGDASECEYDLEDEDKMSEKSYDGSDADNYYELKETRKERKRELLEQRERHKEEKKE
jgi:hypothetical protein